MKKKNKDSTYVQNTFNVGIATKYGSIDIALLLEYFKHCLFDKNENKFSDDDGRVWFMKGLNEIHEALPYLSTYQITKLLTKFVSQGFISRKKFGKSNFEGSYAYSFPCDRDADEFLYGHSKNGEK